MSFSFHEKQIQRPAPPPGRFFPSHSNVVDYYYGNLIPVIKLLEDEELIFVMYYAPWCAESVRVRTEFIKAAKVMGDAVSTDLAYSFCLHCCTKSNLNFLRQA